MVGGACFKRAWLDVELRTCPHEECCVFLDRMLACRDNPAELQLRVCPRWGTLGHLCGSESGDFGVSVIGRSCDLDGDEGGGNELEEDPVRCRDRGRSQEVGRCRGDYRDAPHNEEVPRDVHDAARLVGEERADLRIVVAPPFLNDASPGSTLRNNCRGVAPPDLIRSPKHEGGRQQHVGGLNRDHCRRSSPTGAVLRGYQISGQRHLIPWQQRCSRGQDDGEDGVVRPQTGSFGAKLVHVG
mmetsp:Transcript_36694/g.92285  ORF Transcript_36694/g.92285 Transcript_36694/m.92285 type:complete len:242 (+) Transcript_36694:757-1482(+)